MIMCFEACGDPAPAHKFHSGTVTHHGHNVRLVHNAEHLEIRPASHYIRPTRRLWCIKTFGVVLIPCKGADDCKLQDDYSAQQRAIKGYYQRGMGQSPQHIS